MHETWMLLDAQQSRHFDRSCATHSRQVVPNQVDDHDVLGGVLISEITLGETCALDRTRHQGVTTATQE
jgi:hypothetical protein